MIVFIHHPYTKDKRERNVLVLNGNVSKESGRSSSNTLYYVYDDLLTDRHNDKYFLKKKWDLRRA